MRLNFLRIAFCFLATLIVVDHTFCQGTESFSQAYRDSIIVDWVQDLYSSDLMVEGDSTRYLEEKRRLTNDDGFRKLVYPEAYTWRVASALIERQELKKAFWYFINLYRDNEENKEKVIKCFLTYTNLFKMDEVIFNTFYTYCNTDPQISKIIDGEPEVFAPHIFEEKQDALIEILSHIKQYQIENGSIRHDHNDGHDHGHDHGEGSDHNHDH